MNDPRIVPRFRLIKEILFILFRKQKKTVGKLLGSTDVVGKDKHFERVYINFLIKLTVSFSLLGFSQRN